MMTIIEILLVMFLFSKQYVAASLWVMSIILFQMSYERGNEHIYLEIIEDYPIEDCVKPKQFKAWYRKLNKLSIKDIPKEMYYCETIRIYGFIIYSLALIVLIFYNQYIASLIGAVYIGGCGLLGLVSVHLMVRKRFIKRYKILNRYNIRYLFDQNNEPYPKKIGKCHIIAVNRMFNKTYATVRMVETGEIKERVLLQRKNKQGDNPVYDMYEICKVYYVV